VPVAAEPSLLEGWYARLPAEHPAERVLVAVLSDAFPAGSLVDLPEPRRPRGWRVAVRTAGPAVRSVEVALPDAPLLWYVELAEPDAQPAATTLIAFSDRRCPDGAFLTAEQANAAGVTGGSQVAAIRWWPPTGLVHQLYVASRHRRRGVAGKLVQAAFGVQAARGLPRLHGDGRRTDLGEQFRNGLPEYASWRLAPWSQRLPPMDPAAVSS
jgi:GNAT superfamily N-acetyltransferase